MSEHHTPGPWELQAGRSFKTVSGEFYLSYGQDKHGNPNFRNFCELDANARLIAAAPETAAERDRLRAVNAELVKAIEHALSHDDALKPEYQLPASLSWELREAIKRAKAKGE